MEQKKYLSVTWSPSTINNDGCWERNSVSPSCVVPTAFRISAVNPRAPNWQLRSWIVRWPFFCIKWSMKNSKAMFFASSILSSFSGFLRFSYSSPFFFFQPITSSSFAIHNCIEIVLLQSQTTTQARHSKQRKNGRSIGNCDTHTDCSSYQKSTVISYIFLSVSLLLSKGKTVPQEKKQFFFAKWF